MSTHTSQGMPAVPRSAMADLVEIALDQIRPSPFNRKKFSEQGLSELAASIVQTNGVVEPVILRTSHKSPDHPQPYELVAGERRWLASKLAVDKLKFTRHTITAIVKELTDDQAMELLLIENGQREDVHPLELARIYRTLLGKNDSTTGKKYTPELIAERVKKAVSSIYQTMQLDTLIPEIQQGFLDGKINSSHAVEICRLQPKQQEQVFLGCFGAGALKDEYDRDYKNLKEVAKDKDAEASVSVRQLRHWIQENVLLDLSKAPFDPKDEFLLKGVGACGPCPKRAGSNPGLFGEVAKGDTCTDPGCYEAKKEEFVKIKLAEAARKAAPAPATTEKAPPAKTPGMGPGFSQSAAKAAAAPKPPDIQQISSSEGWQIDRDKQKKGVLYKGDYNMAKPGCKVTKMAMYVDGTNLGKTAKICGSESCKNHDSYSGGGSSGSSHAPVTFERKMEIWNQKVQYVYRDSLAKAIVEGRPPAQLPEEEVHLVADYILDTMNHNDKPKLRRLYGLKEDKSFEAKGLTRFARGLKGAELLRFILVCSLIHEIGLEEQYFGGNLKKTDPLAVVAASYKVDQEKLLDAAKVALEKKRPKTAKEKEAIAEAGDKKPATQTSGKAKGAKKAKPKKAKK